MIKVKKKDLIFFIILLLLFSPFFLSESIFESYKSFNSSHGIIMSFIKFGILATLGEVIGLRIVTGNYNKKGFGILPKVIIWGFLGILIKFAFIVFATGTPNFLKYLNIDIPIGIMKGEFTTVKLLCSFSISVSMNLIFGTVLMTLHKITDEHISRTGGTIKGLFSKPDISDIFINLNWNIMWNFVFKKTIPLFWIPAHTITFLLPAEYQILFAALLGVALGVILAFAGLKGNR